MPRNPEVQWWESRKGFYGRVKGKSVRVGDGPNDKPQNGPHYVAAVQRWTNLRAHQAAWEPFQGATIRHMCEKYLTVMRPHWAKETFRLRVTSLHHFIEEFGDRTLAELRGDDLRSFLAKMQRKRLVRFHTRWGQERTAAACWGSGSIRLFITSLRACCQWAFKEELLPKVPGWIYAYQAPRRVTRDCLLTVEQIQKLCEGPTSKEMRRLVAALAETGARPSELLQARGRNWDPTRGAVVHLADELRPAGDYRHKTAGKGKTRVIRFPASWHLELTEQAAKRPDAPLFPSNRGRCQGEIPLRLYFSRMEKILRIPGLCPYALRC